MQLTCHRLYKKAIVSNIPLIHYGDFETNVSGDRYLFEKIIASVCEAGWKLKSFGGSLPRMTLNALKHRDVSKINRMLKRLTCLVTTLTLPVGERA